MRDNTHVVGDKRFLRSATVPVETDNTRHLLAAQYPTTLPPSGRTWISNLARRFANGGHLLLPDSCAPVRQTSTRRSAFFLPRPPKLAPALTATPLYSDTMGTHHTDSGPRPTSLQLDSPPPDGLRIQPSTFRRYRRASTQVRCFKRAVLQPPESPRQARAARPPSTPAASSAATR